MLTDCSAPGFTCCFTWRFPLVRRLRPMDPQAAGSRAGPAAGVPQSGAPTPWCLRWPTCPSQALLIPPCFGSSAALPGGATSRPRVPGGPLHFFLGAATGCQWEPAEFLEQAKAAKHPVAPFESLPETLQNAAVSVLTTDPVELARTRLRAVMTWTRKKKSTNRT